MAVTLIINPGSSSKKYSLFSEGRIITSFRFERNEQTYEICREHNGAEQKCEGVTVEIYRSALAHVLSVAHKEGVILADEDIASVGIRIVCPGTFFQKHRVVDDFYIEALEKKNATAPLHIPHTLSEIKEIKRLLPKATLVGVSDSQFHASMPEMAREYAIDKKDTTSHDLYRFGYHGLSYSSIAKSLPSLVGKNTSRVVVCHIGSGMSMCAMRDGVSIDTTMGFAPGSGLMMGTRTGDLEPAVLLELMRLHNMKPLDVETYLQTRGGFVGQTMESDFRHLLARLDKGDEVVEQAFKQCVYRFQKTLGSYFVALQGIDAVILTATAAERSPKLREIFLSNLECLGIYIDVNKNEEVIGADGIISTDSSPIKVFVERTNEFGELLAATQEFSIPS